ncbi:hypothetical protein L195_g040363 [Trifolium pratense]|uniref:Uncharacterized protein n=1 Tax=Trifolium pratense TaxID=57577 RepID=A0A2K3M0I4_TRIPR|nr:hypothetical protein L195_g040363 [Trifolium pratense]
MIDYRVKLRHCLTAANPVHAPASGKSARKIVFNAPALDAPAPRTTKCTCISRGQTQNNGAAAPTAAAPSCRCVLTRPTLEAPQFQMRQIQLKLTS